MQINTLCVHNAGGDNPALRITLANLLNNVNLEPTGISPSAILIIRHINDPLPGRLVDCHSAVMVNAEWERAGRNAINNFYNKATRPERGLIPSGPDAVLFKDEAEMLACLALDISKGEAWRRWWWKVILKTLPPYPSEGLRPLFCKKALYLPAAFNFLVEWGQVITVVNTLSLEQALTVLSALCHAYDIADFTVDTVSIETSPGSNINDIEFLQSQSNKPAIKKPQSRHRSKPQFMFAQSTRVEKAPWDGWIPVPFPVQEMGKERVALLGLALCLYNEPARARTPAFARLLRAWWVAQDSPAAWDKKHPPQVSRTKQDIKSYVKNQGTGDEISVPVDSEFRGKIDQERKELEEAKPKEKTKASFNEESATVIEEGLDTRLGGILYLINLMVHLNLLACFEESWRLASQVGAWGVLEVLGRTLLGQDYDYLTDDPIWLVLAKLDGREKGELPGHDLKGSDSFRLPFNWYHQISPKDGGTYHWAANNRRLRLWSEKGYLLLDCLRTDIKPLAQVQDELRAYVNDIDPVNLIQKPYRNAPVEDISSPFIRGLNENLKRLFSMMLPFIRLRLGRAFSMAGFDESNLAETLLLYRGKLYISATHLDLVMSIDDTSLPVRQAGLDIDPGWLPDFGRVVKFHYQ